MTEVDDPRMRFRVWVSGYLIHDAWVNINEPDAEQQVEHIKSRHAAIVNQACELDRPWLVEIYDPAKPEHEAYWRIGDDVDGMVDPRRLQ